MKIQLTYYYCKCHPFGVCRQSLACFYKNDIPSGLCENFKDKTNYNQPL